MKKLSWFNRVVFAINVLVAFFLLLIGLFSFLQFQPIPALAVLSLFVPILFVLNGLFVIYWLVLRKRKFLWSLWAIILGYIVFGSFYGLGSDAVESGENHLKVMTYNVWGFNKNGWIKEPNIGDRIIDFVKKEDPDILCFQEYDRSKDDQMVEFKFKSVTLYKKSTPKTTQAIFSKFPIVGSGSLDLPGTINNVIYADIVTKGDTVRVYNVHLQSFNIVPSAAAISNGENSERTYKRLVNTFTKQLEQAKLFREHLGKSPHKNLVCGDFNNTQFSNIYKIIKGDLQDTFREQGTGFGRTYDLLKFPIRIDYILADPDFEVLSHQNFNIKLSDHYPVMSTLRLQSHQ
ncbi:endonuclease/exonuclease/phosphatase family protein [Flagellimonas beolgyonensis]|uniref:endonuclease/exonuclease/phosphatase family protein n=1 Tax=Flagellimonas beolgyonensis TaxID=864064 RepID=UPI000F8F1B6A|nr:endonuclease/exonuclease/phosphatase family protein [Allomuricauda beolgyonensis]